MFALYCYSGKLWPNWDIKPRKVKVCPDSNEGLQFLSIVISWRWRCVMNFLFPCDLFTQKKNTPTQSPVREKITCRLSLSFSSCLFSTPHSMMQVPSPSIACKNWKPANCTCIRIESERAPASPSKDIICRTQKVEKLGVFKNQLSPPPVSLVRFLRYNSRGERKIARKWKSLSFWFELALIQITV